VRQVCTTCLVTLVIIIVWRKHVLIALAFFCTFIFIEGIYFSATLFKIPHGAPPSGVRSCAAL
jgi:KUP system potassium uptake protein